MDLFKNTLYINLEHREDRNLHVKTQLSKIGIKNAIRMNAVKTSNGAIGCSLSHIKCLEMAKKNGWEYVFICEDDIHFTNPNLLLKNMGKFEELNKQGFQWDVLLVGGNNCPPHQPVLESNGSIVQISHCRTTIGYIARNHYYDVLIQNFREGVSQLIKEPENKNEYAIDMYWNRLQQKDLWFLLVPLTVSQLQSYSDVENRIVNYDHIMLDLDKEWLFARQYHENVMQNMTCIHRKVDLVDEYL